MNWNRILKEIQPGELEIGQEYWMIPVSVYDTFSADDKALFDAIAGVFSATVDGETYYFIPLDSSLNGLEDLFKDNEFGTYSKYISSAQEIGDF